MERHEHDKATEIIPAVVAQEVNKSEGDDDDDEDNGADGVQQPQQQPQQPPQPQHADMDHRDSKGYDAMLHAAVNRRLDVLEMFLERRPDLCESACNQGMTGMMIGARQGHHDVVEFLLESGADRDRVDALGNSALMWAGRYGHTHVVELIMKVPYIRKIHSPLPARAMCRARAAAGGELTRVAVGAAAPGAPLSSPRKELPHSA